MLSQDFGQALFAELLSADVERFAYTVGVECQSVSRKEPQFPYRAIPFLEQSEYGGCGVEPLKSVVVPEEKSRPMPAICVAQMPRVVVVFGKKEGGVSTVLRILVKKLVHRLQEAPRLSQSDGALAAQIGLQIRH